MFVRQVKRKCSVRGCKSTDCYAISRTREVGNTVIICKSCLGKALGAIDEIDPKTKSNIPVIGNTVTPPLFFNAKALGTDVTETKVDDVPPVTDNEQEVTTPPADVTPDTDGVTPPADGVTPDAEDVPPVTDAEVNIGETAPPEDITAFTCPICGRVFDSEKGLKTHLRHCKAPNVEE